MCVAVLAESSRDMRLRARANILRCGDGRASHRWCFGIQRWRLGRALSRAWQRGMERTSKRDAGMEGPHTDGASESNAGDWDERYRGRGSEVWSGRPNGVLLAEISGLVPGRALDVGCGEGADAIWLAQQGWQVTGVDISQVALDPRAHEIPSCGSGVISSVPSPPLRPFEVYNRGNLIYRRQPVGSMRYGSQVGF